MRAPTPNDPKVTQCGIARNIAQDIILSYIVCALYYTANSQYFTKRSLAGAGIEPAPAIDWDTAVETISR